MQEFIQSGSFDAIFSVCVAAYLLIRMEHKLEALNDTLTELTLVVRAAHGDRHHHDAENV